MVLLVTLGVMLWRVLENTLGDWLRKRLPSQSSGTTPSQGETLVRCDICGVHVPQSRALSTAIGPDAPIYCSDVCRQAGVSGVC